MRSQNQELQELLLTVRKALLGITTEITQALKEIPEKLDKITHQIYEFNKLMLDTQMKLSMMGVDKNNTFLKQNKALFKQARDVIEGKVYNYLNANKDYRDEYKQNALKGFVGKEGLNETLRKSIDRESSNTESKSNTPKLK